MKILVMMAKFSPILIIMCIAASGTGWTGTSSTTATTAGLVIVSPAFSEAGRIPNRYTCAGADVSPPLRWRGIPRDAQSLALVLDDPDAPSGIFTHWIVYNIDPRSSGLAENPLKAASPTIKFSQAVNDFGHSNYNGPCPPPGTPHHYHFKLYALASTLHLSRDATVQQFDEAIRGRVLAMGELVATFKR
jgi:Raf kinase inhibitor-like YbhB/YbcL family protein